MGDTTYASPRKMEAMKGMSRGGNGVRNANGSAKVRKMNTLENSKYFGK